MKNLAAGSKMNAVAAVFAVVAMIATIVSSNMYSDLFLPSLTTCIVAFVAAVVLCVVAMVMAPKNDMVRTVSILGAIAALMFALNNIIGDRVLMIAGLFSFNQGNTAGWNVFYVTIVAAAALILSCVSLMVGAFGKATKE